jgi:ribosomal protein S27E
MVRCPKCKTELKEEGKIVACYSCNIRLIKMRCPKCSGEVIVRIEEKFETVRCDKCKETLVIFPEKAFWKVLKG